MMRTPDPTAPFNAMVLYGTFSAAQWDDLKADLAAVGIDLDTATLPPMDDKPWWLPADSTLRDAIQHIAGYYGLLLRLNCKPPTPLQRAEALQAAQTAAETARDLIARTDLADDHTWTGMRERLERRDVLDAAIRQEIADLKQRIAALMAKGSASTANPKTLHNDYWREQARLWLALKPNVGGERRKHLERYLLHCSASLFTPDIESKIAAFVGHLFTSKRSPK
jgi:hypothetical protein